MRRPPAIAPILLCAALAGAGCGAGAGPGSRWKEARSVDGSVTTVRTVSGSRWGGAAHLEEVLSIGSASGADHELFGQLYGFAFTDDRVYVLDNAVPAVRMYDLKGRYLGDIGKKGQGPGEYMRPWSIAVAPDRGLLFVRDDRMGRIQVFDLEGAFIETWRTGVSFGTSEPMIVDTRGVPHTTVMTVNRFPDFREGMVGIGPEGALGDTLEQPLLDDGATRLVAMNAQGQPIMSTSIPFSPRAIWAMTPQRDVVSGIGDRFRFRVDHPDGTSTVIEREADPIPVLSEEADWHRRRVTANMRTEEPGWVWKGPGVPPTKPYFREFFSDDSGRIWVIRADGSIPHQPCADDPEDTEAAWADPCWTDAWTADVFERTGSYLGEVLLPADLETFPRPCVRGEMLLASATDADGIPYVRLYRIVTPDKGR